MARQRKAAKKLGFHQAVEHLGLDATRQFEDVSGPLMAAIQAFPRDDRNARYDERTADMLALGTLDR